MHTHCLTSPQMAGLMQLEQRILSQSPKLCINAGDLQPVQLVHGLCAAHRGGQGLAISTLHMGTHEVMRHGYNFKDKRAMPLAPAICLQV